MASEKCVFYRRTFLNRRGKHSTAFIFAEIVRNEYMRSGEPRVTFYTTLKLSDCDRQIDFDVIPGDENDMEKLDKLITVLSDFRDECVAQAAKKGNE